MAAKVFILGRPGSGKTTAAHYFATLARDYGCFAAHINDYEILKRMSLADCKHLKFCPTEHNGFDVLDFSVLDTALQELEKDVQEFMTSVDFITIEFARDDYDEAFKLFSSDFLRDAFFLYIDTDIETCLQRIHERVAHPTSADDHPSLSDEAFKIHYRKDNRPYMTSDFAKDYDISDTQVEIIDNTDGYQSFLQKINKAVGAFFKQVANTLMKGEALQENSISPEIEILQETYTLVMIGASAV